MIVSTFLKKTYQSNQSVMKSFVFKLMKSTILLPKKLNYSFSDVPKRYPKKEAEHYSNKYSEVSKNSTKPKYKRETSITQNYQKNHLNKPEKYQEKRDYRQVTEYKDKEKQNNEISLFFEKEQEDKLSLITKLKEEQKVRELSMIAQEMLFESQSSETDLLWCALEEAFISLIKPTKNQNEIRSYGKFLYSLGKSKKATHNYETQMALLLPFSSHQSFTQIVTSISRMGGMSEEFSHIVEKLYWKRKEEFSKLEINLINYVLAKNGKKIDTQLIEYIPSFPLKSIVMLLKSYDMSSTMTSDVLKECIPMIVARKQETNFLDLRGIVNIYSKYLYLDDEKLINYIVEQYKILARNVTEEALEEIWQFFPQAVNANKFPIAFVEEVIKSLKILRTRERISERTWKKISITFGKFENLEIRTQLEKI